MSILEKLTEGIVNRDVQKEGQALLNKWEQTGLLEGIDNENAKSSMAVLLENQAKELLREASAMAAGDVEGFASVAFPIVRRVFGGLIANQLVSVQPMSLPSGLSFFLDFTYESARHGVDAGDSLYGGGVVASQITGGVSDITEEGGGFYNLANAYSHATGTVTLTEADETAVANIPTNATGANGHIADELTDAGAFTTAGGTTISSLSEAQKAQIRFDADILSKSAGTVSHMVLRMSDTFMGQFNK